MSAQNKWTYNFCHLQDVRLSAAKALTALGMFAQACEAVEK